MPKADPKAGAAPFWRTKTLEQMSPQEWESLCDGCARCCLVKLEDEETGDIHYTDVACTLLDAGRCRCRNYANRQTQVADCVRLTPETVRRLAWLPPTCAYRLVAERKDLPSWHPLVSGDRSTVHTAGISVRNRVAGPEESFTLAELLERVTAWPTQGGNDKKQPLVQPSLERLAGSEPSLGGRNVPGQNGRPSADRT